MAGHSSQESFQIGEPLNGRGRCNQVVLSLEVEFLGVTRHEIEAVEGELLDATLHFGRKVVHGKPGLREAIEQQSGQFPGAAPDFQYIAVRFARAGGYHFVQPTGNPVLNQTLLFVGRGGLFKASSDNRLVESSSQNDGAEGQVVSRIEGGDGGISFPSSQLVFGRKDTVLQPDDGLVPGKAGYRVSGNGIAYGGQLGAQTLDAALGSRFEEAGQGMTVVAHAAIELVQGRRVEVVECGLEYGRVDAPLRVDAPGCAVDGRGVSQG